jgi:hypothetical protein
MKQFLSYAVDSIPQGFKEQDLLLLGYGRTTGNIKISLEN